MNTRAARVSRLERASQPSSTERTISCTTRGVRWKPTDTSAPRKPHRHLASPDEVVASLNEAAADPSAVRLHSRAWPELRFVDVSFRNPGAALIPPPAFYAVGTVAGSSAYIREDGDGSQHALRIVTEGALLIHSMARGFQYAWTAPHQATWTCLDPEVVRNAAAERRRTPAEPTRPWNGTSRASWWRPIAAGTGPGSSEGSRKARGNRVCKSC